MTATLQSRIANGLRRSATATAGKPLQAAIIRHTGEDRSVFPPVAGTDTAFTVTALQTTFNRIDFAGGNVENSDLMILVEAGVVEPLTTDKVKVGGFRYTIVDIKETAPGGSALMYKLHLRGGVPDSQTYIAGVDVESAAQSVFQTFFVDYQDDDFSASLPASTAVALQPVMSVVATNRPVEYASHDFWVGGRFSPINPAGGDGGQYEIEFEVEITPSILGEIVTFTLAIGPGNSTVIETRTVACSVDAGGTERLTVTFDNYVVNDFFFVNGGLIRAQTRQASTISGIRAKVTVERDR